LLTITLDIAALNHASVVLKTPAVGVYQIGS